MKSLFLVILLMMTTLVYAQTEVVDPCEQFKKWYDQTTIENNKLSQKVKTLEFDSTKNATTISNLKNDTLRSGKRIRELNSRLLAQEEQLRQMRQRISVCAKDSARMRKELNSAKMREAEDCQNTVTNLRVLLKQGNDSISRLTNDNKEKQKRISILEADGRSLNAIRDYVQVYTKSSVDDLFATCDVFELERSKEMLKILNIKVPLTIDQTLSCFEAKSLLSQKYDKVKVNQLLKQLPNNVEVGRKLSQSLQYYATMNAEASALWSTIQKELFQKPISNDNFEQTQTKRQIWKHTQNFLNKYPTLDRDYPYIYEQIQAMMRAIWENANNFTKIPNPFK